MPRVRVWTQENGCYRSGSLTEEVTFLARMLETAIMGTERQLSQDGLTGAARMYKTVQMHGYKSLLNELREEDIRECSRHTQEPKP